MLSAIQIKLLLVIIGLLASIGSYLAYEQHQQQVREAKVKSLFRAPRPDEKKALDASSSWGSQVNKQRLK
ncbi:MAG TPA: hypothetical protein VM715_18695 [Candidatus Acidoferrum sp.]|jgi:hypothetical protein|nr:hypothetical protein [Candidatus Acidoferrum sp.]